MDASEFGKERFFICGKCNYRNEMRSLKKVIDIDEKTGKEIEKFCCCNCDESPLIIKDGEFGIGKSGGAIDVVIDKQEEEKWRNRRKK